jgi:hypothetical protein
VSEQECERVASGTDADLAGTKYPDNIPEQLMILHRRTRRASAASEDAARVSEHIKSFPFVSWPAGHNGDFLCTLSFFEKRKCEAPLLNGTLRRFRRNTHSAAMLKEESGKIAQKAEIALEVWEMGWWPM